MVPTAVSNLPKAGDVQRHHLSHNYSLSHHPFGPFTQIRQSY